MTGVQTCALPIFHYQLLAHAFQTAHLVNEGFHDDDGHHREKLAIFLNTVNLEDDEPLAEQVDVLRGVCLLYTSLLCPNVSDMTGNVTSLLNKLVARLWRRIWLPCRLVRCV